MMPIPTMRCDGQLDRNVRPEVGMTVWKEVLIPAWDEYGIEKRPCRALVEFRITAVYGTQFECMAVGRIDVEGAASC